MSNAAVTEKRNEKEEKKEMLSHAAFIYFGDIGINHFMPMTYSLKGGIDLAQIGRPGFDR